MSWRWRAQHTPIGVDVNPHALRAAQVRRLGTGWRVSATAAVPRAEPEAPLDGRDVQRLIAAMRRRGFRGSQVVLTAPPERLLTGMLELPPRSSGAPVEQLARVEMSRLHKRDVSTFELACWDLPSPARAAHCTHVMAVAYAHSDADALLDLFEGQGLNVCAIDTQGWALIRACAPMLTDGFAVDLIVDLGWDGARASLVHQGVIVYERGLSDAGLGRLQERACRVLQCDRGAARRAIFAAGAGPGRLDTAARADEGGPRAELDQAIHDHFLEAADDLRISMSYVQHRYPDARPGRVLLVGDGAAIPGLGKLLGSAVGTEAAPVVPVGLEPGPTDGTAEDAAPPPALAKAVGLALYTDL
jgi:Tfp pilus assembly PilM family ATPase